jgi:hypothetical protein
MKVSLASFVSDDGKRRVEIFDHQDGFFSFEESRETTDLVPEYGPDTYWTTSHLRSVRKRGGGGMRRADNRPLAKGDLKAIRFNPRSG